MNTENQVEPVTATEMRRCWGYPRWMVVVLIIFVVCEILIWGFARPNAVVGLFLAAVFAIMRCLQVAGMRLLRNLVIGFLLVLFFVGVIIPVVFEPKDGPRRMQCQSNLKQLGCALWNYHNVYGCLPPAFLEDEEGNRVQSWRTLLLPYLEESKLYEAYDLSKPWNSTENRKVAVGSEAYVWRCPTISASSERPKDRTDYVAVVGDDTFWPADGTSRSWKEATAGTSNTAILIETEHSDIAWNEPRDLTIKDLLSGPFSWKNGSVHPTAPVGRNVLFGDGSVHYVPCELTEDQIRRLFSITEPFDLEKEVVWPEHPALTDFQKAVLWVWFATLLVQLAYSFTLVHYKAV